MRLWFSALIAVVICKTGDGVELTGLYGRITSPNFPKPYPNDQTITWTITTPIGHRIKIYFTYFNLELSYRCEYDYLKLNSKGTEVAHLCGKESTDTEKAPGDTVFYSLDNKMTVTFRSDYSNEKEFNGFELFYTAEDINECESDTEICDHFCHNYIGGHYCSCRPGFSLHSDKKICTVQCGSPVYKASSGEVTSPDYPGVYPKLSNCKYSIQAEEGFSIHLKFLDLNVESHPDVLCPYDSLQIKAGGKDFAKLCGDTVPAEMDTRSNMVEIIFMTDSSGDHTGWKIQYTSKALPCPKLVPPPRGNFVPSKSTYVVNDKVSVFCEEGYVLIENEKKVLSSFTALCQKDGMWDKSLPKCEIVNCGMPEEIENGNFTFLTEKDVTTYQALVQYECHQPYYYMKEEKGRYRCGALGYWEEDSTKSRALPNCLPDCGINVDSKSIQRIIGGKNADLGNVPWQVLIETDSRGGGALLYDNWVITAAHVMKAKDLSEYRIKMGMISTIDENSFKGVAEEVFIHERFDNTTFNNDIALIKLKNKAPLSRNLMAICLPTKEERFRISHTDQDNHIGLVAGWGSTIGWGHTAGRIKTRLLKFVEVEVIDHAVCKAQYMKMGRIVYDNMICAGDEEGGKDSCNGDSGGALAFRDRQTKKWFHGGIVSWGVDCGKKGQYGVYTKVSNYIDWIEETIQKHG
ncbi:mannan-binding lectin serine protease 2 isoform X2 [Pelobates fuscus]|uniref:mannan-binding lectin serine protease 2 isoform X2 n=1 Tax=Pelobates fuscus TaxID=191477 RepID=UPI002FE4EADD